MKKIVPYKTKKNALTALDNGGYFYNLFSKAGDGEITSAELLKSAGVFSDKQKMILHFEMSIIEFEEATKELLVSHLSEDLQPVYWHYLPLQLLPSQVEDEGEISASAIITGVPRLIGSRTEFNGFIMVPIMAGKVMTFTMIPIMNKYDVYELKDHTNDQDFLIAHHKSAIKLPEEMIRCGGILKELKPQKDSEEAKMFLETLYYSHI